MSQSANISSIDALKDLREAMVKFCETVQAALCANEMESQRMYDWLTSERPNYWAHQLRERQEDLAEAQAELHRLKLQRAQGMTVDDIQQKKAVDRAKAAIEEAEEKLEKVEHWKRIVQRAMDEYQAHARPLGDMVEGNPPRAVVFLDRVLSSIDAYLGVSPTSHQEVPATSSPPAPAPSSGTNSAKTT